MILVTGATGFLGKHLLAQLEPQHVRVLARKPPEGWQKGGVQLVEGDLLDRGALARALEGVTQIYHLAGLVSRNPGDATAMYRIHVEGTRALCEAARAAGVSRMVVASSSGTVAVGTDPERIFTEEDGYATECVRHWPYYLSKIYQEQTALRLGTELGLEVVVLSPSLLLGPGDDRLSSTGDVLKFLTRSIPAIPSGGLSFVDARDAALALVLAMARGAPGERYLIGGPNWTFEQFFGRLERLSKVMGPKVRLPRRAATLSARLLEGFARVSGRPPAVDAVSVEMAQHYWYLDAAKARRVLGWEAREPAETLLDTIHYLERKFMHRPDALAPAQAG